MKGWVEMTIAGRSWAVSMGVLAVVGPAGPALAKMTQYECRFAQESAGGGGWIPEILVLTEDDATGEILAFDPIIKHFVGTPIAVRLSERTKVRSTFRWELETQNRGQSSRMTYTFSYFSDGKPARMSAQPGGYDNKWKGEGTCKLTQG
jgi:hypothetical protein